MDFKPGDEIEYRDYEYGTWELGTVISLTEKAVRIKGKRKSHELVRLFSEVKLAPIILKITCECGAHKSSQPSHSTWCPLYV